MHAKSFIAFNSTGQLMAATKAQLASNDQYRCHLCRALMKLHTPENGKNPWFEHIQQTTRTTLVHKLHDCPYLTPDAEEMARVSALRRFVPEAQPVVQKGDWYCTKCRSDYHAEKYCTHCQTGIYSIETASAT